MLKGNFPRSTGAGDRRAGQLTPEQLPSNLRLPDAHADVVSQLSRPLSYLLYKLGKQQSGDGGLELSSWSLDPY